MSILITSHNMTEVEEMCDKVVFLNHGKIFAQDTPERLAKKSTLAEVRLMVKDGLKRLIKRAEAAGYRYEEKNRFIVITLPEQTIASFLTESGKDGIEYSDIEIVRPSLEDFFLSMRSKKL